MELFSETFEFIIQLPRISARKDFVAKQLHETQFTDQCLHTIKRFLIVGMVTLRFARFPIHTVTLNVTIFWDVTPCSVTMFGRTYSFYHQASTLKLEAVSFSEILKYFSLSTLQKTTIFKLYIVHETAVYPNPHIYIVLLEKGKFVKSLIDQKLNMLCFYENVRKSNFCRHNLFTEGLFVTQLSSHAGTAV